LCVTFINDSEAEGTHNMHGTEENMDQSPSSEANSHLASQPEGSLQCSKQPAESETLCNIW